MKIETNTPEAINVITAQYVEILKEINESKLFLDDKQYHKAKLSFPFPRIQDLYENLREIQERLAPKYMQNEISTLHPH